MLRRRLRYSDKMERSNIEVNEELNEIENKRLELVKKKNEIYLETARIKIHHVIPLSHDGTNHIENFQVLYRECHYHRV